ncbi:MAG: hypothetical protein A3F17_09095 [Gammaproteobacteria bacterium RIFCSPHIGHO2_12_FULL_41_15]|nr:MAG: hypothetical protein A3F17_09095 [Gammaproteobacteria bacterium RIFCSPHIGHO2_12_FULL_41_15]
MDDKTSVIRQRFEEALAFFKSGKVNTAQAICKEILHAERNEPHTLQLLGLIAIGENQYHDAIIHLKQALLMLPDNAICHHNLASAYNLTGEYSKAEQHYLKAIAISPKYVEAFFNYAFVADLSQHKEFIKIVLDLLALPDLSNHNVALLHFAAGKYHHTFNEYDLAFEHFQTANKLEMTHFNIEQFNALVKATLEVFDKRLLTPFKTAGNESSQPLFIVGMPTSGSILLDNILCRHPNMNSVKNNSDFLILANELSRIRPGNQLYPHCVNFLSPTTINNLAKVYLNHIQKYSIKTYTINHFTLNVLYLGLIKLLFPNARIIHMQRHPLDACLSCYFTLLQNHCEFCFSLDALAAFYQGYVELMQHWKTLFYNDILTLNFEDLATNPEDCTQTVLNFLQLDEPLSPIDREMVNQSYKYSIGFSQHYTQHVHLLIDALKPY